MREECIIISIQWVQGFSFVIWDGEVGSCVICRTKVLVISEVSHISAAARARTWSLGGHPIVHMHAAFHW